MPQTTTPPTLLDDAVAVLNFHTCLDFVDEGGPRANADHAALRIAKAIVKAANIRTVAEDCRDLAIVDAKHYEALLARCAEMSYDVSHSF